MIYLNLFFQDLVLPQYFQSSSQPCQGQQDSDFHYSSKTTEAEEIPAGQWEMRTIPYSPGLCLFCACTLACCLQVLTNFNSNLHFFFFLTKWASCKISKWGFYCQARWNSLQNKYQGLQGNAGGSKCSKRWKERKGRNTILLLKWKMIMAQEFIMPLAAAGVQGENHRISLNVKPLQNAPGASSGTSQVAWNGARGDFSVSQE